jgi:uroporphyrinogen III methyltransferase/synthase
MGGEQVPGTVYLVGAGPGDPGLITVAGRDALARADVVFYDRLAHPALLNHALPDAERVFVGKAAAQHFVRQEDTNALMAERALAGKTVVRLKGGDPFVFGRGGEEAQYLRQRGIPFVIVPGVTSAIAAAAYAGIPITHRDLSSSFAVITGHERDDRGEAGDRVAGAAEQRRRWDRIAWAADTLVFLMGVEALEEITSRLIENDRPRDTPVALVQWGTWSRQRVVEGTLSTIVSAVRAAKLTAPAITIVGDVVRLRDELRWFDIGPLFGRRIVVTRAREQASALSERLRACGADPIEFPTIRVETPEDGYAALDAAVEQLDHYDWIVFTSTNAVGRVFERLTDAGRDVRAFGRSRVAAVGSATVEALASHGIIADFAPTEFVAEAIIEQFPEPLVGRRILLPSAAGGRTLLADTWRGRGVNVDVAVAYRTAIVTEGQDAIRDLLVRRNVDAVTFTSSSTVRNFVEAVGGSGTVPAETRLVAIGPITAQTCRELLREPDAIAVRFTIDGVVDALIRTFTATANETALRPT